MLIDITSVAHAVKYAQKIARKMSRDPEVDSIAGEAAWKALYTYDASRNVKLSWWIAQLTKQVVIHYWRRMSKLREREKMMDELWWQEQSNIGRIAANATHYEEDNKSNRQTSDEEINISPDDWQLLVESFILRHPLDVIARDHGMSVGQVKKIRAAAISRLEAAC